MSRGRSTCAKPLSNMNSATRVAVVTSVSRMLARPRNSLPPRAEVRADLVSGRLGSGDEALVGNPPGACHIGREADRREDVEIVRLAGVKRLAAHGHVREL